MSPEETIYVAAGRTIPGAVESKMFGKSCFKLNGKAFTCFYQNCMVFKLGGDVHKEAILLEGSKLFDPSGKGRPMKEWVQVPFAHNEKWESLVKDAAEYQNMVRVKLQ